LTAPARRLAPVAAIAAVSGAVLALWALDLFGLKTPVLTPFGPHAPLTPLYAFWLPQAEPLALAVFAALAAGLVAAAPRWLAPEALGPGGFALRLAAAALLLALALFRLRAPLAALGENLTLYPGEEVYYDALRIGSLAEFYREYVARMPELSLHGKHFPPGHATLLFAVGRLAGFATLPAALAILGGFVAGVVLWYRAFRRVLGESQARVAALLLLASPALLDFACTSLDAVFFAASAVCALAAFAASAPGRGLAPSLGTGAALFGATLLSFSALPLGLAMGLFLATRAGFLPRARLVRLASVGAGYLAAYLALWAFTGFDLVACFRQALGLNTSFMTDVIGRTPLSLHPQLAYGNAVAFALGAGPALLAALLLRGAERSFAAREAGWVAATLAVMTFGALYQLETERIWLFALPWLALLGAPGLEARPAALRALLAAGCVQAAAMESLLFTLW
jgi:hypothetical protein